MTANRTQPDGPVSQEMELLARMVAGCACFISEGGFADATEAYDAGLAFWGAEIWQQVSDGGGGWITFPMADQLPKAVISSNQHRTEWNGGDCSMVTGGKLAVHVYMKPSTTAGEKWHGQNFFGALTREIMKQVSGLNAPAPDFPTLTLPIQAIELIGPTRTPILERGPENEYDFMDGVYMIDWGCD